MPSSLLTVTFNPAVDKMIVINDFRLGEDFRADNIVLSAGGKGLNISRLLKNLGKKSTATGLLAGTTGAYIKKELQKEGIAHNFLKVGGETRTNLTVIDRKQRKITRILEQGPGVSRKDVARFKRKFASLLKRCDYVIFSGSLAPGLPDTIYADLISVTQEKNVKTVLDTSGRPLLLGLRAKPFLIKPNIKEAEFVLGYRLNSMTRIKGAVRYFLRHGIKTVLISMGAVGTVASQGEEILFAMPPVLKCLNNVGCGDALVAGFIFASLRKFSFKESLRFAVACGAANTQNLIPGFVKPAVIKRLTKKTKIREV